MIWRIWVQPPSAYTVPDVEAAERPDSLSVLTSTKTMRVIPDQAPPSSVTSGVDCNKVGPPREEYRVGVDKIVGRECPEACPAAGKGFGRAELGLSLGQSAGSDCIQAKPPLKALGWLGCKCCRKWGGRFVP